MIRDAVRLLAAALCGTEKTVSLTIAPVPELRPLFDFMLVLSSTAQVSPTGDTVVKPILRLPISLGVRYKEMTLPLFELLAGVSAKMNTPLRVAKVTPEVTEETLRAYSDARGGILYYIITENGVSLNAFSLGEGISGDADVSPEFVAGALLGTVVGLRDAAFRLGRFADTEPVKAAVEAIKEFGGAIDEEGDVVTVHTVRYERFRQKDGRRIRQKKNL